jgi:hypothetical protein
LKFRTKIGGHQVYGSLLADIFKSFRQFPFPITTRKAIPSQNLENPKIPSASKRSKKSTQTDGVVEGGYLWRGSTAAAKCRDESFVDCSNGEERKIFQQDDKKQSTHAIVTFPHFGKFLRGE